MFLERAKCANIVHYRTFGRSPSANNLDRNAVEQSKRTVVGLSVDDKDAVPWDRDLPAFGVRLYPLGSKVCVV